MHYSTLLLSTESRFLSRIQNGERHENDGSAKVESYPPWLHLHKPSLGRASNGVLQQQTRTVVVVEMGCYSSSSWDDVMVKKWAPLSFFFFLWCRIVAKNDNAPPKVPPKVRLIKERYTFELTSTRTKLSTRTS